ncbi:MAG: CHASE2 domain-containing protein, partial [Cyanobacteria bacterium P01_C01_bin.72]
DSLAGVEIQAHMTSQIISAVLDDRPLLWSLSQVEEAIWILSWSLASGVIFYYGRSGWQIITGLSLMIFIVFGGGWILLSTMGGWVPLLPSTLVIILVGSTLQIYQYKISHRS